MQKTLQDTSTYRQNITKLDIDPGYFSKYTKDQIVLDTIKKKNLKNILDIGCDTCYIYQLLEARKHEFEYIGIDKNNSINTQLTFNKNFWFMQTENLFESLDNLKKNNIKLDCILLLDVIEHMENKDQGFALIEKSIEILSKDGYILLSTPNCMDGVINWPKYHSFEFSLSEIYYYIGFGINKRFPLVVEIEDCVGWSMSNEMFNSCYKNKYTPGTEYLDQFHALPMEMRRVLLALGLPGSSRDILLTLKKVS
jgi:SAM-dependent methyltransferase